MLKTHAPAFALVALLAALGMVCASLFGFVPVTPKGVQCPTAPVQTVRVRNCCGRLVTRAPKPGEKAFVQCRCAEKKSASHDATLPVKVTFFLLEEEPVFFETPLRLPHVVPAYTAVFRSVGFPPTTRPPAAA